MGKTMSGPQKTTDHGNIQRWAEKRVGKLFRVKQSKGVMLAEFFVSTSGIPKTCEESSWKEFLQNFDTFGGGGEIQ
jgi:hypothetical protein